MRASANSAAWRRKGPGRVLIVDLAVRFGGPDVRVIQLAKALHGRCEYLVATMAGSPLHEQLQGNGLATLAVPFKRWDPRLLPFLRQAVRRENVSVVDAHNVQSQFWAQAACVTTGARMVATVHSSYRYEHGGSLRGRAYEQVLRSSALAGASFIAVSEAVQKYLREMGIDGERIALIHNSIALEAAPGGQRHELLQRLNWGPQQHVVAVVGRLETVKGHRFLLQALADSAAKHPQLRCLIVGEGRVRPELENEVARLRLGQYVHLAGFRSDVAQLLANCQSFCLPSLSEGLPYALLEACVQRLPLVVSKVGGMAELLTHLENAYLVAPASPEALAEGLTWLVTRPQEAAATAQRAFDLVARRFSVDAMISNTVAAYARSAATLHSA